MKRKINLFLLLWVFFPCMIFMSACGTQSVKFNIKFMVDNEVYSTVETGGKETIAMPEDPIKEGYNFDGWYWDENIWSQPFTANSLLNAPLSSDMKVYAKFTYIHTHNLTKVDKKEPTCTENGYEEYYTCECGKMFSDENGTTEISKINILSAIGHTFSEWYELKPASYTEKGTERRDCSICEYYEIRDIEKLVVEIVDPTELNVEYGILKWDGTSPYGFDVIVNGESQKVLGNSLETQLKSDDYNSVCVACIYENGTKGNYIELNNFVVNAPISNLHFTDNGTNVTFTWDSASELYDYTFVVNNQETTVSKDIKTYSISRNSVAAGTEISVYVNGVDSANFKPSKKTTIKLEQLDHPNLSINKLDVEWENVENSEYYLVKGLTNITTTDTKYSYDGASSGDYTITVEVYGDDYLYNSSTLTFKKLIKPDISIENKIVSWNAIAGQVRYATLFNNNETKFSANSFKIEEINTEYEMFLYASPIQANTMQSDIIIIKQFVYEEHSNIYWGDIVKNEISYSSIMLNNDTVIYVPECCQSVDFSNINSQNLTLISNKRPDSLKSSLIVNCTIPSGTTSIQNYAFRDCNNLTSIIIPNSVKKIGMSAFTDCVGLTSIAMPESLSEVGIVAFNRCHNLTEVHISNLEAWLSISFGSGTSNPLYYAHHLYLKNVELTEITIPDSVTEIKDFVLLGASSITSITISNNTASIGKSSFEDCSNLTSIIVPNNVTTIGEYAFAGCTKLTSITLSTKLITIGSYAFKGCGNLISIDIPNSVTAIYSYAFEDCSKLTSIVIPNSITIIYCDTFYNCNGLTSITIPSSVTDIGMYAFYGCENLKEVHISSLEAWFKISFGGQYANPLYYAHHLYLNGTEFTEIIIPDTITEIKYCALDGASSIDSVVIPKSVTSIGWRAFAGSSALTQVIISDGLTTIDRYAFADCIRLTSLTIPNSVIRIGNYALYGCTSLETLSIPFVGESISGNTYLGYIFGATSSSSHSSHVPSSLKTIIVTGDTISSSAFSDCSNTISIIIPTNITNVGGYAFYNCVNFTIYCEATSKPSGWDGDWNISKCTVYWYRETQPSKSGNYWHYVDGVATKW